MALTRQERTKIDLEKKIRLENKFKIELKALYNFVFSEYRKSIKNFGEVPNASDFTDRFAKLINNQYKRVSEEFASSTRSQKSVQLKAEDSEETLTEEILAIMLLIGLPQSKTEASIITQTNQKLFQSSLETARTELIKESGEYTNLELSLAATAILKAKNNGRVGSTAVSETQWAAESTKFTESELITGAASSLLIIAEGGTPLRVSTGKKKVWSTIIDGLQRDSHNAANKQSQLIENPFIVGGEMLMYPADRSMGASAKNVINCRCSAIY